MWGSYITRNALSISAISVLIVCGVKFLSQQTCQLVLVVDKKEGNNNKTEKQETFSNGEQ